MTSVDARLSTPAKVPSSVYIVLLFGIAAVSMAAIFISFAQREGIPSAVIASGRLGISALLLTPFALRKHIPDLRRLTGRDLLLAVISGVVLAIHFLTWITSLEYTSVLISTVFVTTGPLWVALLEVIFLRARFGILVWLGLFVALVGGITIGLAGSSGDVNGTNPALGGGLALAGAVAVAIYFVIGRNLRAKLPLLPYIWLVYSCTAVALVVYTLLSGETFTGYSATGYFWVVVLALFPQLIGHTSFNYALRYVSATYVSIITQAEPVGSAIAAIILFSQIPTGMQVVGSVAILIGVMLSSYGQSLAPSKPKV